MFGENRIRRRCFVGTQQVHERQTARMRTRSEWFLTPVDGSEGGNLLTCATVDSDPTSIHVLRGSNTRSSSGNIGKCVRRSRVALSLQCGTLGILVFHAHHMSHRTVSLVQRYYNFLNINGFTDIVVNSQSLQVSERSSYVHNILNFNFVLPCIIV